MLEKHGKENVTTYILTVMNMVRAGVSEMHTVCCQGARYIPLKAVSCVGVSKENAHMDTSSCFCMDVCEIPVLPTSTVSIIVDYL